MPQPRHQPFTYVPSTDITPIACPHCGARAHLISRSPLVAVKGEMRTFRCKDCGEDTKMIVRD